MEKLSVADIIDPIVIIKINRLYHKSMSSLELYEATRGVWKRKINSVSSARICLSVYNGVVVEVYTVFDWHPAGTTDYKTRNFDESELQGRIEFTGSISEDNIREKYIGKSVEDFYKLGEADPVKVILPNNDINKAIYPASVVQTEEGDKMVCPSCGATFFKALRCPECGQKILYKKEQWNKPKLKSLEEWERSARIIGAAPTDVAKFVKEVCSEENFTYSLGAVDIKLRIEKDGRSPFAFFMLFGKERCGAIQPKAFYSYFRDNNLDVSVANDFLEDMRAFLSPEQKTVPYERENGFYFVDYSTIVQEQESLKGLFIKLRDEMK